MIDLRQVRNASGKMAKDVAADMGMSERSGRQTLSQFESRGDWLFSSVRNYLNAVGATAQIVITVNGKELWFDL